MVLITESSESGETTGKALDAEVTAKAKPGDVALYEYDFGDSWEHEIRLEDIVPREKGIRYPRCIDGARACPPEDCGGPYGFERMLEVLADPNDEEHDEMWEWIGEGYDPARFEPGAVRFDNPKRRWRRAFSEP